MKKITDYPVTATEIRIAGVLDSSLVAVKTIIRLRQQEVMKLLEEADKEIEELKLRIKELENEF